MADPEEHRTQEEIRQRMEAVIKRAQKAPANPHAEFAKGGKGPKGSAPKARNFRHQGR